MKTTKRNFAVAILTLALMVTAALMGTAFGRQAYADADQTLFTFEKGLAPFKPAALKGQDVTAKTLTLAFEKKGGPGAISGSQLNGFASLDSETGSPVWMQAEIPADLETDGDAISIEFQARNVHYCGGCITLVYAGRQRPTSLVDFTTDFQSMGETWGDHKYLITIGGQIDGTTVQGKTIYLAIGFTHMDGKGGEGADAITSGDQIIGVDNVTVKVQHLLPPPAPEGN